MATDAISYYSDGINYTPKNQSDLTEWIASAAHQEGLGCGEITFVFTTDEILLGINREYLDHDTYTDIITFDYSEEELISGEIYISIERVRDNALRFSVSERDELHRVIIHGILHLCGYTDKTELNRKEMRAKEDYYLSLRTF